MTSSQVMIHKLQVLFWMKLLLKKSLDAHLIIQVRKSWKVDSVDQGLAFLLQKRKSYSLLHTCHIKPSRVPVLACRPCIWQSWPWWMKFNSFTETKKGSYKGLLALYDCLCTFSDAYDLHKCYIFTANRKGLIDNYYQAKWLNSDRQLLREEGKMSGKSLPISTIPSKWQL